jgi:hypothetical protein
MLTIPSSSPVWTNEGSSGGSRSQDLTITWSGGAAGGLIAILGSSADPSTRADASFQCLAPAETGSFIVPAWVLSALPPSGIDPTVNLPVAFLMVGTTPPQPTRFQATGIDVGFFNWIEFQAKNSTYQ